MKVYVGADHKGFYFKERVEAFLQQLNCEVEDKGDDTLDPSDDFTTFAARVVAAMQSDEDDASRGILICGSGQGMVMAANRFQGVRAGLGWSVEAARSIRNDEDSNVLALPAELIEQDEVLWQNIVKTWIATPFAGAERYKRRIRQLDDMRS